MSDQLIIKQIRKIVFNIERFIRACFIKEPSASLKALPPVSIESTTWRMWGLSFLFHEGRWHISAVLFVYFNKTPVWSIGGSSLKTFHLCLVTRIPWTVDNTACFRNKRIDTNIYQTQLSPSSTYCLLHGESLKFQFILFFLTLKQ